jgi:ethanolamine utilization protein EutA
MTTPPKSHSLADHAFGALVAHEHGEGDFDHDHDEAYLEIDSKSLESVPLISMGLDVGSSGTQVIFTRLEMRGPGEHRALRRQAKTRETLYMSPIALTPFEGDEINEEKLWRIIDRAFNEANLTPDDIETGAIILTGAAAQKHNAQRITTRVAEEVGELVCATAGDHMEAMLAAFGSGAVAASAQGAGKRILNIDIGGATTKFALCEDGRITSTAAMTIGGRQIALDLQNRITRLDATALAHAQKAGVSWQLGAAADKADLSKVAEHMAQAVMQVLRGETSAQTQAFFITEPLAPLPQLDGVIFSGGVAEYIYGQETRDFGDLGWRLGRAIRRLFDESQLPLMDGLERIRATAFGASEHAVQISGQTIFISDHAALLPVRNLPVLQPVFDFAQNIDPAVLAQAITHHRHQFDCNGIGKNFALAFRWRGAPDFARLSAFADGIVLAMRDMIAEGRPLYVMLEGDAALTLGAILKEEKGIATSVLVIDGLVLRDFDFVDIGRVRLPSFTVPVTIKSLLFGTAKGL